MAEAFLGQIKAEDKAVSQGSIGNEKQLAKIKKIDN